MLHRFTHRCINIASNLHLAFLITPMEASVPNKVWKHYYALFEKLSTADQRVAGRVGVTQSMLVQLQNGRPIKNFSEKSISILRRFLNAQMVNNNIRCTHSN